MFEYGSNIIRFPGVGMDKREKRDLREQEIIDTAINLLAENGFLGMRMSDIAKATGYSMGTLYSHFESKEDLIVACAHVLCQDEKNLFDEIAAQPIPSIEKIITLAQCSWLYSMQHPELIEIDSLSLMPSIWCRATSYRAERLNNLHVELANTFLSMVLETIENGINGHVHLDEEEKECLATHLTHGMWGMCVGLSSTAQSGYASTLCPKDSDQGYAHFTTNYTNFLKGYGWQEEDPQAVFSRCLAVAKECINHTTWFGEKTDEKN
jgi:AcrR family transcriptional regulator